MNRVNLIGFILDEPLASRQGGHSWIVLKTTEKVMTQKREYFHKVLVPKLLFDRMVKSAPLKGRTLFVEGKLQQDSGLKWHVFAQVAYVLPGAEAA